MRERGDMTSQPLAFGAEFGAMIWICASFWQARLKWQWKTNTKDEYENFSCALPRSSPLWSAVWLAG